jgi:hypothetical protein
MAQLQGQLHSSRALGGVQQLLLCLALLALGTGWAPSALWALVAAAGAALVALMLGFGSEDPSDASAAVAARFAAQQRGAAAVGAAAVRNGAGVPAATAAAGGAGALVLAGGSDAGGAAVAAAAFTHKGLEGAKPLRVVARTSEGSGGGDAGAGATAAAGAAPPPMAPETEALLVGRVMGGKTIDETVRGALWSWGGVL